MNQNTYEKTQFNDVLNELKSYCLSSYSKTLVEQLKPSSRLSVVENRLQETQEATALLAANLHMPFMGLTQLEYLTEQVAKGFVLEPRELVEYADFLRSGDLIKQFMAKNERLAPLLATYSESLHSFSEIADSIYSQIKNNQIDSEASRELRKVRRSISEVEEEIQQKLNKFLRHSNNRNKIQEFIIVQKNQRYTVPVKASYKNQIGGTIIETSTRGTTVFIEPTAVTKLNDQLFNLKLTESGEVYQIQATLTGLIAADLTRIKQNLEGIVHYDLVFARGKYSRAHEGIAPKINDVGRINLVNVIHPLLGEEGVPLNLTLGTEYHGLTITGPNAGGKTVVLKTLALVTLQTMIGLLIKADSGTEIAIYEGIYVDIGDQQSLSNALSTFSGHLKNIGTILEVAKPNSLILLDEIGSGTEPSEGAALAIAIMEAFYQRGCTLLTTTHYGEIKTYSEAHPGFTTAAMAFNSETLTPLYQLVIGETGESNAFWLGEKMALSPKILAQGKRYLAKGDYDLNLRREHLKTEVTNNEQKITYYKGDRVRDLSDDKTGLIYEVNDFKQEAVVLIDEVFVTLRLKRLELLNRGSDLYPADYDLERLFTSHKAYKEMRDLTRGSKKAHRRLDKEARQRRLKK